MPERLIPMAFSFLLLITPIVAVVFVLVWWRKRLTPETDPGIGTVRRLYFYIISFVALMMVTNGVALIIQYVLQTVTESSILTNASTTRLATGISMAVVGLPLWAAHWRIVQRYVGSIPVERRSILRKLYLYLVLIVGLAFISTATTRILEWAFRTEEFPEWSWAVLVVWAGVWAFHWRLESDEGQPTQETRAIRNLYIYLVAAAALGSAASGVGLMVHTVLREGYEAATTTSALLPPNTGIWRSPFREALAMFLVAGVGWAAHWLYFARVPRFSLLRRIYIYLFGILGGSITMLVASGIIIYGILTWVLGVLENQPAAEHFRFLPGTVTSLGLGFGIWAYHWSVAGRERLRDDTDLRRVYEYILVAVGVGLTAAGIVALSHLVVSTITNTGEGLLSGQGLWKQQLSLVITFAALGVPLWVRNWLPIERRARPSESEERTALVRRVFVLGVLAAGLLALVGSTSGVIFYFLRDALESDLSRETLRDAQTAVGFQGAVALLLPYFWLVYRQDRLAMPEDTTERPARPRKSVTAILGDGGDGFLQRLEDALGYRVTMAEWADPDARSPVTAAIDFEELAQRISDCQGDSVLIIPDVTTVRVLSYF